MIEPLCCESTRTHRCYHATVLLILCKCNLSPAPWRLQELNIYIYMFIFHFFLRGGTPYQNSCSSLFYQTNAFQLQTNSCLFPIDFRVRTVILPLFCPGPLFFVHRLSRLSAKIQWCQASWTNTEAQVSDYHDWHFYFKWSNCTQ